MMDRNTQNRHERRRLQTRRQLLQTTLDLVLEKGYDAVSIQDITDRADLGRGTFYIHFKDKEEVVWTMLADIFAELEREAHRRLDPETPQAEYYGFLNIFRHAAKHRDLYRLVFGVQGNARLTARVQDWLAKSILQDILRAPQPGEPNFNLPHEFEAQLLTGVISRLLQWWLEMPQAYPPEQMAAMTYEALYRKAPSGGDSGEG